jgi:hypothetical protein
MHTLHDCKTQTEWVAAGAKYVHKKAAAKSVNRSMKSKCVNAHALACFWMSVLWLSLSCSASGVLLQEQDMRGGMSGCCCDTRQQWTVAAEILVRLGQATLHRTHATATVVPAAAATHACLHGTGFSWA